MSSDPQPILTLPPDVAAAVDKGEVVPPPTHPLIIKTVRERMCSEWFGPSMRPTVRQRLLYFSSFTTLMRGYGG